jgi:prepilin-type N-terminal cleavage/methylation domain-containing protein
VRVPNRISNNRLLRTRGACSPHGESGFTLVELLITMTMLSGIMAALMGIFTTTGPVAGRDQSRALGIMDAQVGLAAMTRDLRQTTVINSAGASAIDFNATIGGVTQRIIYDCTTTDPGTSYKRCVKATSATVSLAPSLTGAKPVIARVANGATAVFTYSPVASPTFIGVHLEVPRDGGYKDPGGVGGYQNNVSFDAGVYMPNRGTQ